MKRKAIEFVVDGSRTALVTEVLHSAAGEALKRLTLAPVDGTPRYKITALLETGFAAIALRAVMNALDKSG